MHVRESKLYAVVAAMSLFMGGWGSCKNGMEKIDSIERELANGWSPTARLDQCDLRAWVMWDTFIALMLGLAGGLLGAAFGNLVFSPILYWLTSGAVGNSGPWVVVALMTVILHLLVLCWYKVVPDRTWRPLAFYMRQLENLSVWCWKKLASGTRKVGAVNVGLSKVVDGFAAVAAAGREVKKGVCVVYDRATPETKVQWAKKFLLGRYDLWHKGTVMLVVADDQSWGSQVKAQIIKRIGEFKDPMEHVEWQVAADCNLLVLSLPQALAVIANLERDNLTPQLTILHDMDEPPQVFHDVTHLRGNYHDMLLLEGARYVRNTEVDAPDY